jgi:amino acid permease
VGKGMHSIRNFLPRAILRTIFVALSTLVAAAIPFFGDIAAFIGAVGFTPLDFVLPFVLYSATFKPSPRTFKFWLYKFIMIFFSVVALVGCVSSVRQIIEDSKTYKLFANLG